MTGQPDPALGAAIDRAVNADGGLPVYVRDNFSTIRAKRANGIRWRPIWQAIIDLGIRDSNGSEPTLDALIQAYKRVERAQKRKPPEIQRPLRGRPPTEERGAAPHSTTIWDEEPS